EVRDSRLDRMRHRAPIGVTEDDLDIAPADIEIKLAVDERTVPTVIAGRPKELRIVPPLVGHREPLVLRPKPRIDEQPLHHAEHRAMLVAGDRPELPRKCDRMPAEDPLLE